MLSATNTQAQQDAAKLLADKSAKQKAEEQINAEKAHLEAQKKEEERARLALEGKLALADTTKAEKVAADKEKAKQEAKKKAEEQAKQERLAAEKEEKAKAE